MDRPNLTPEQQQDQDPKEPTLADLITKEYALHPHFVMKKGGGTSYVSLEDAIPICEHYAAKGYTKDQLFEMLNEWNENAKAIEAKAAENPAVTAQYEALKEGSKSRIAEYVLSLKG